MDRNGLYEYMIEEISKRHPNCNKGTLRGSKILSYTIDVFMDRMSESSDIFKEAADEMRSVKDKYYLKLDELIKQGNALSQREYEVGKKANEVRSLESVLKLKEEELKLKEEKLDLEENRLLKFETASARDTYRLFEVYMEATKSHRNEKAYVWGIGNVLSSAIFQQVGVKYENECD